MTTYYVDKAPGCITQAAQPASGSVIMTVERNGPSIYKIHCVFTLARMTVTDAAASGSSASLKLGTFTEGVWGLLGSRHNWTAFAESSAVDTGAGDAAFVIAFGSAAADAGDGALTGTEVNFGATRSVTLSGGTGTGATTVTAAQTALDGTATAIDLYLNWSGSAATVDANGTFDCTGTATFLVCNLNDD